jgi:hypothetical protein
MSSASREVGVAEIIVEDDRLPCSEVGAWAENKYTLVGLYDRLFSTGMKKKWQTRVYIDLYSGPGFVRVRGTGRMLMGSPLLALGAPDTHLDPVFVGKKYLRGMSIIHHYPGSPCS